MDSESRVYVAGNTGLVGSAIVRMLHWKGYTNILSSPSSHWDLRNQSDVERFFRVNEPEYVYLAAAKVGGIGANADYPGHFIYDNLMIQTNVIHAARKYGVKKLLFLGSSCIYPKFAKQPITEDQLLTGPLEGSNDAYAVAKIAGIKMCKAYRKQYGFNSICLMPTNLYGPNDNYDLDSSHVLPALIRRFYEAAMLRHGKVTLWGDGSALREFLHVDDLAEAAFTCMKDYDSDEIINVGTGKDISIKELAMTVADVISYKGDIEWDTSKPNGTPRKVLNVDKIKSLGWEPKIELKEGIQKTYQLYKENL
tara:strand:+ start:3605 stop:4531 length:927 start_codon:yes stop_codon:yes gene_type:complete